MAEGAYRAPVPGVTVPGRAKGKQMITRTGTIGLLGVLALGGAALGACGSGPSHQVTTGSIKADPKCTSGMPTVSVEGYGTVNGVPNQAVLSLGIQTQDASAVAAMRSNAVKASAVVKMLEAAGVPATDLQTSGLQVQPNYNNSGTVITSYGVSNTITVTINDLSLSGTLIDDAARIAGNAVRVNDISFDVQNETGLLGRARAQAVSQAVGQARIMATAAGMTLGPLCSLQDNTSETTPPPMNDFAAGEPAAAVKTPIEAGTEQVTANVTAVYGLVPAGTSGSTGA
ncbi:MAG TPA: SIMPL domain-containing protein [Acidimicrobiales bacterium]|nr:SIMPL domain-containing protein [Acidimicrobiales bacterium]